MLEQHRVFCCAGWVRTIGFWGWFSVSLRPLPPLSSCSSCPPNVEATLSEICARYDTNGDGEVDVDGVMASVDDFNAGLITYEDYIAVIDCFYYPDDTPTPVPPTPTPTATATATPTPTGTLTPTATATPDTRPVCGASANSGAQAPNCRPPTPTPIVYAHYKYIFNSRFSGIDELACAVNHNLGEYYSTNTQSRDGKPVDMPDGSRHTAGLEIQFKDYLTPVDSLAPTNSICIKAISYSSSTNPGATFSWWEGVIYNHEEALDVLNHGPIQTALEADNTDVLRLLAPNAAQDNENYMCPSPCKGGEIWHDQFIINKAGAPLQMIMMFGEHTFESVGGPRQTVYTHAVYAPGPALPQDLVGQQQLFLDFLKQGWKKITAPESTPIPPTPTPECDTASGNSGSRMIVNPCLTPTSRPVPPTATPTLTPVPPPPTPTPTPTPDCDASGDSGPKTNSRIPFNPCLTPTPTPTPVVIPVPQVPTPTPIPPGAPPTPTPVTLDPCRGGGGDSRANSCNTPTPTPVVIPVPQVPTPTPIPPGAPPTPTPVTLDPCRGGGGDSRANSCNTPTPTPVVIPVPQVPTPTPIPPGAPPTPTPVTLDPCRGGGGDSRANSCNTPTPTPCRNCGGGGDND